MHPGRKYDAHDADEHQTAEKRIKRSEELRRVRLQAIDRTHPAQDHRRIQECIDPSEASDGVVAHRPGTGDSCKDDDRQQYMATGAPEELRPRQ